MKTLNKQISSQDDRNLDIIPDITKDKYNSEVMKFIFRICESSGSTCPVNDDDYNDFINLTNKQITAIIKGIIIDRANDFNQMCNNLNKSDKNVYDLITTILDLIARGIIKFGEETRKLVFYKPIGNPPNEVMEKKIQKKIEESKPLIFKAFKEVFAEQKKQP